MFDNLIHDYHRFECFLYCGYHTYRNIRTHILEQTLLTEVKNICIWNSTMKKVFQVSDFIKRLKKVAHNKLLHFSSLVRICGITWK